MKTKRAKGEGSVVANQIRSMNNKLNPEEQFTQSLKQTKHSSNNQLFKNYKNSIK